MSHSIRISPKIKENESCFREVFKDCAELLRANAQKGGAKKPHCDNMIFEAIELIDELTKEAE